MKTQISIASFALLAVICLTLAALPASADTLYDNGPVNGNANGWAINFGSVVSDSFTAPSGSTVTGFALYVWELPGDTMTSVEWSLTSQANDGTVYGSGTALVTDTFVSVNQYGYDLAYITHQSVGGGAMGKPTQSVSYLNLQNATTQFGDPLYWDENSGVGCQSPGCPSSAYDSALGTIPSEAFTIYGSASSTPEPGSLFLLGSGALGIGGLLRKRLFG
jgi:PEP-CTERM motif